MYLVFCLWKTTHKGEKNDELKFCSAERDWSNHYRTEIFALAHSLHIKAIERKNLIVLNCPDKYMAKTIKMHFIR